MADSVASADNPERFQNLDPLEQRYCLTAVGMIARTVMALSLDDNFSSRPVGGRARSSRAVLQPAMRFLSILQTSLYGSRFPLVAGWAKLTLQVRKT